MNDSIYKIFQTHEWTEFKAVGKFHGSLHDIRDGFIHLCTPHQIEKTLAKHYRDADKVILAQFCQNLLAGVKWEASKTGEKFPHIYGVLSIEALKTHVKLTASLNGGFTIPDELMETQ